MNTSKETTYVYVVGYTMDDIEEHMHWQADAFSHWYKVGVSEDVNKTLSQLQEASPCPFTLFCSVPFDFLQEAKDYRDEILSIYEGDERRGDWINPALRIDITPEHLRVGDIYTVKTKDLDLSEAIREKQLDLLREAFY